MQEISTTGNNTATCMMASTLKRFWKTRNFGTFSKYGLLRTGGNTKKFTLSKLVQRLDHRCAHSSTKISKFLQSRVSFTVATGLWVGVCGSLLFYVLKRRRQKNKDGGGLTGPGAGERHHTINRRFSDKVVVITGAAGDIGGTTATAFAREGATLVLVDLPRLENVLKEKSKILKSEGASSVLHVTADVTKQEDVQRMVEYTIQKTGKINCLFKVNFDPFTNKWMKYFNV